jgi:pimeloyl-ACP methyl ester carboxylesterase
MTPGGPSTHITPYDRIALDEATLVALLAGPQRNEGLVEYFGTKLHDQLVKLARFTLRNPPHGPRVYVLPGIMGSQLGFIRGERRPNDILWLDPIDFQQGRMTELRLSEGSRLLSLGAMSYTYLKLTLSLRKAGFDAVLLDYDWRRDIASSGKALAGRIAADGMQQVGLVGHSMGGLVARAALTHAAGKQVSRLVMLGTPNSGSFGAVQAVRGTYSVVRKLAMLDLRHDAEILASEVFSSFPGLYELLPSSGRAGVDLFDPDAWPSRAPGPAPEVLRAAAGLPGRLAPADDRFHVVVGCNRTTATRVIRRDDDFEYEYSLHGDGTVPVELAQLDGARHRYVDCGHSELPLDDRVIAGTVDLLANGRTRRFASAPRIRNRSRIQVSDAELRREYVGKVDWSNMTPAERRQFLDTLNEPPRRTQARAGTPRKPASANKARKSSRLAHRTRRKR